MNDFPVNEEREELEQTAAGAEESVEETFEDDGFSTIFANPTEHKVKSPQNGGKKRLTSIIAGILAVAVLIGGTVAVIKLIPEKQDETASSADSSIVITDLETDDVTSLTVKNSEATFKFVSEKSESSDSSEAETVWYVDGTDKSLTSSSSIESIVSTASSFSAVSEITGKDAAACGINSPSFVVTIVTADGSKTMNFGALSADGLGYYMQISGEDKIYLAEYSLVQNFEFKLLDLADTTALAGISTDDINVKYVTDGAVSSFDSITLTGKNFPSSLVIKPNNDASELGQYFNYVITSPQNRVADKVDSVFNLFVNGLSVSGAYAFDVSAQSLKSVGLDNPYLTATIKMGEYSLTYKISKPEDGYCAVVTNNSSVIHKVDAASVEFLEYKTENFYSNMAFLRSLMDITKFTFATAEATHTFDITYYEEKEDDQFDIIYNGNKLTSEFFQNFYQEFVGVTFTDFKDDCDLSNTTLTVTATFSDGHTETVAYAKDSATKYACVINGECLGRVSSTDINALLKDMEYVIQNKDIP